MEKYYSYQEVANILEVSVASVKNYVNKIDEDIKKEHFNNNNQPDFLGLEEIKKIALKGNTQLNRIYELKKIIEDKEKVIAEKDKKITELEEELKKQYIDFLEIKDSIKDISDNQKDFGLQFVKAKNELLQIQEKKEEKKGFFSNLFKK